LLGRYEKPSQFIGVMFLKTPQTVQPHFTKFRPNGKMKLRKFVINIHKNIYWCRLEWWCCY